MAGRIRFDVGIVMDITKVFDLFGGTTKFNIRAGETETGKHIPSYLDIRLIYMQRQRPKMENPDEFTLEEE